MLQLRIMHDELVDIQEHDEMVTMKLEQVDEEVLQVHIQVLMV